MFACVFVYMGVCVCVVMCVCFFESFGSNTCSQAVAWPLHRTGAPEHIGVSEHMVLQVTVAELFYLRHLRSCAASAGGKRCTCSRTAPGLTIPGGDGVGFGTCMYSAMWTVTDCTIHVCMALLQSTQKTAWSILKYMWKLVELVISMCVAVLHGTLWVWNVLSLAFQYVWKLVLYSNISMLETGACFTVVEASESGCQGVQTVLAIFVLILALSDWHVPSTMPHHYNVCRLFSAMCMQALYPSSPTLICWAFADPTFGKRSQTPAASAPSRGTGSNDGAAEHVPTSPGNNISLDDAIAQLRAVERTNDRGEEILAAAITLRDSRGRDRKEALRSMASTWHIARNEKVDDKWKARSVASLAKDIETAVCDAALQWQSEGSSKTCGATEHIDTPPSQGFSSGSSGKPPILPILTSASAGTEGSQDTDVEPNTRIEEGVVAKKAKTYGATEHTDGTAKHTVHGAGDAASSSTPQPSAGTVHELQPTPNDVICLSRLGPDMFEAALRSGEIRRGDSQLLSTLPHADAKRATLEIKEFAARMKAKAKPKASTTEDMMPVGKRQKTIGEMFDKGRDVSECGGGQPVEPGAPEHGSGIDRDGDPTRPQEQSTASLATTSGELLGQDMEQDHALLEWLRSHQEQPRCAALLQQMMEWTGMHSSGKQPKPDMHSLAKAQEIHLTRRARHDTQLFREAVREHFKAAIAQEKGRLACFQFNASQVASEQLIPTTSDSAITIAEVVDLQSLKQFRRQQPSMPDDLKQAIVRVAGGYLVNRRTLQEIAKSLGVKMQYNLRYPGTSHTNRAPRCMQFTENLKLHMLRSVCFRRVRDWATSAATGAQLQSTSFRTPQTTLELTNMLRDANGILLCPFGVDFGEKSSTGLRLDNGHRIPFWLALIELHSDGYRYGTQSDRDLPYVFQKVVDLLTTRRLARRETSQGAPEHLINESDDLARALMTNPVFRHKVGTHDILSYAMKDSTSYLKTITVEQLQHGDTMAQDSLMPAAAADAIARTFFEFVFKHNLANHISTMTSEQIQVIALFLSHLLRKPAKRVHISERLDLVRQKHFYTPADAISSPQVPHFVKVSNIAPGATQCVSPTMQAPFICQLCGDGFINTTELWKHAEKEHHSWSEYRKRLIFEVQQCQTIPLQPIEKRRLASNFYQDLLHSYPGRNTIRSNQCTMRQIVACTVCAIKDWIDDFYPCFVWKDAPLAVTAGAAEHGDEEDFVEDEQEEERTPVTHRRTNGPQLRDDDGFCYFGPTDKIHALLDVDKYRHVIPLCPIEELHASSIQHPRFPTMRWLMHTRRVPVLPSDRIAQHAEDSDGATEHVRPPCAGIGNPEKPCWLCHHCASHLCSTQPRMPPQALANWNWGGREHPRYQNLTMACKSLLGLGKLIMRMVLLKPTDNTDESEKAIVGNTILVAKPSPEIIAAELPPTVSQQTQYFNVVYAAGATEHGSSKLPKKKALTIDRQEYLECAQIRKERCPVFADKHINVEEAQHRLSETGVPNGIEQGAVQMEVLQHFQPTLSGPATIASPFCADQKQDDEDEAEAEQDGECIEEKTSDSGCHGAPDALIAEENANAEFLIGLDGSPDDDAIGKLAAIRAKTNLAHEMEKRIRTATLRAKASEDESAAKLESAADVAALLADHKTVCVDVRTMARGMGERFQEEVERSVTAAYRTSSPATLRVYTGAPLSLFDPAAWVACLTEFFYGDCAPNLERPAKISWRYLFRYLMNREELEYHLDSDIETYGRA